MTLDEYKEIALKNGLRAILDEKLRSIAEKTYWCREHLEYDSVSDVLGQIQEILHDSKMISKELNK